MRWSDPLLVISAGNTMQKKAGETKDQLSN
jgi:hypothetical protein